MNLLKKLTLFQKTVFAVFYLIYLGLYLFSKLMAQNPFWLTPFAIGLTLMFLLTVVNFRLIRIPIAASLLYLLYFTFKYFYFGMYGLTFCLLGEVLTWLKLDYNAIFIFHSVLYLLLIAILFFNIRLTKKNSSEPGLIDN